MLMLMNSFFYLGANLVTVTTAAPGVLSSAVYKNERVSATVTSEVQRWRK